MEWLTPKKSPQVEPATTGPMGFPNTKRDPLQPQLTRPHKKPQQASKRLLNEVMIQNQGAPAASTRLDALLMAEFFFLSFSLSLGQRTGRDWRELLEGVRLVARVSGVGCGEWRV